MDEFESALEGEVDPAAEFLAREQSELEELGIEDQLGIPAVRFSPVYFHCTFIELICSYEFPVRTT